MEEKSKENGGMRKFLSSANVGDLVNVVLKEDFFVEFARSQVGVPTGFKVEKKSPGKNYDGGASIFGSYNSFNIDGSKTYLEISAHCLCSGLVAEDQIKEVQVFRASETYKF